jgi:hypothetical protein
MRVLRHGQEGRGRTCGWLATAWCLTAARQTDLEEKLNSPAMVANPRRGAVLWVRNKLAEQAGGGGAAIYRDQQRWLRIWTRFGLWWRRGASPESTKRGARRHNDSVAVTLGLPRLRRRGKGITVWRTREERRPPR